MDYDIVSNSPHETIETGARIGRQLKGSEVVAVCGALGSGKTHLIKGIARGAGIAASAFWDLPTGAAVVAALGVAFALAVLGSAFLRDSA